MNNSQSKAYAAAGVDITAGYKAVELMKQPHCKNNDGRAALIGCRRLRRLVSSLTLKALKNPFLV